MNKRTYAEQFHPGICDKCGQPVTKDNSALLVQELATEQFAGFVGDRHLFPTDTCEGSPSRRKAVAEKEEWKEAVRVAKGAKND